MLELTCQITIGKIVMDFVNEIQIESTWKTLTDTCTIKIPRKVQVFGGKSLYDVIHVGDEVTVKYGYNGALRTEFFGYVVTVKPGPPVEIECQDQMWQLKRKPLTGSWRSISLEGLLKWLREKSGVKFAYQTVGKIDLGKFTVNQATVAQVLEALQKDYSLYSFFQYGVLVVGDPYGARARQRSVHGLAFRHNIISHDLVYARKEDFRIQVKAISHVTGPKGGRKRIVKFFPPGEEGELRTLNFSGVSEAQLEARAKAELKLLKFDGYRGSVTSFGEPLVEHGDVVVVQDPEYPEREGSYSVDKVTKSFGVGGSRRTITLGPKAV